MTHQEICNGKLVIIDPVVQGQRLYYSPERIEHDLKARAHMILEKYDNGQYIILKNRNGKGVGEVVDQKEITKFMLRH